MAEELCAALADAEARTDCHVLLLQGAGRFFCAGGDVAAMTAAADQGGFLKELADKLHEAVLAMETSRLVSIAAVNASGGRDVSCRKSGQPCRRPGVGSEQ